jgi:hypothetical protein
MLRIESNIGNKDDIVAMCEKRHDFVEKQVEGVGEKITTMIKAREIKSEMTKLDPSKDGAEGFKITIDPQDIEKANKLGLQKIIGDTIRVMLNKRLGR